MSALEQYGLYAPEGNKDAFGDLCLSEDDLVIFKEGAPRGLIGAHRVWNGIPKGVDCVPTTWCDKGHYCSQVCTRGSVVVDPWLHHAVKYQLQLARKEPLCYAQLLGSHNSAITRADGYGNRDGYYSSLLPFLRWADPAEDMISTNNQWLSLTDQLNLGVRVVELDTHWFGGDLHIGHCGGFHLDNVDRLLAALNLLAGLLNHSIHWNTGIVGCSPSLSSLPTGDQRTLKSALQEIRDWMDQVDNQEEFVVLYFDNQMSLKEWGKVGVLLDQVREIFPAQMIVTPQDFKSRYNRQWPSIDTMVAQGKRILLVSGTDYGQDMSSLVFPRSKDLCSWSEPSMHVFNGPNTCMVYDHVPWWGRQGPMATLAGDWLRIYSCELTYGPLNCDFRYENNNPLLDDQSLPGVTACGVNVPSPDRLTPTKAEAQVWSWAPYHPWTVGRDKGGERLRGEPLHSSGVPDEVPGEQLKRIKGGVPRSILSSGRAPPSAAQSWRPSVRSAPYQHCAVIWAKDGRWYTTTCGEMERPRICRYMHGLRGGLWMWRLVPQGMPCPMNYEDDIPHNPKENLFLVRAMHTANVTSAWLPVSAPRFTPSWVS